MLVDRVEKHIIKSNNFYYKMLDEFCFKSKNLYNYANYIVRQNFINNKTWIRYNELDKLAKGDDYSNLPAKSSQQILKVLDRNWKSFFKTIKDWSKHKEKYYGKPKLPKYLNKAQGRFELILTNQQCKIKDGYIKFPKIFNKFTIKTRVDNIQQVRILPRNKYLTIEVVYRINIPRVRQDNSKYLSIDIGLNNLAAIVNNCSIKPIIISGRKIKSINQYYNKKMSHYRKVAKRMNSLIYTSRMNKLTIKRNNMITDLIHKASKNIVKYALSCETNTIIIGNNKNWKQNSKMNKKVNQSFIGVPHQQFIQMIQYKAADVGINVILTEESYTSGTSFLDNESPIKENYNKSRRKYRGLFISNKGIKINADINGAYQIMKKVFPKVFTDGIEGAGLHPFRVSI
jgi:putative transposase